MKIIEKYEADDGRVFDTKEACEEHEMCCSIAAMVAKFSDTPVHEGELKNIIKFLRDRFEMKLKD